MEYKMNVLPPISRHNIDQLPMKVNGAISRRSILAGDSGVTERKPESVTVVKKREQVYTSRNDQIKQPASSCEPNKKTFGAMPIRKPIPRMDHMLKKGQRCLISDERTGKQLEVQCGWYVPDTAYDVDISVFMLRNDMKVKNDDGLVFYGSPRSRDRSVVLAKDGSACHVKIDLDRIETDICKLVLVLTITDALEKDLNFGDMSDVYISLKDINSGSEICSFLIDEYYKDVTSMTLGEIYRHNGKWRFNPVGNGIRSDLAGQCAVYGIETC